MKRLTGDCDIVSHIMCEEFLIPRLLLRLDSELFSGTKMETRFRRISCVFVLLCITFSAHAESDTPFPHIADIEIEFYQTEVTVTSIDQQITALATEYYDSSSPRGKVDILVAGNKQLVYYNNATNQILHQTDCEAWDIDESIYFYEPIFYGWLNKKPLVIGPSAPLWYAQDHRDEIKFQDESIVRDIKCQMWSLDIVGKKDNVTIFYHFAEEKWTTPYQIKGLRVPVRIEIRGLTTRDTKDEEQWMPINQITDFSYFRPTISDWLAFQPPVGIGCPLRKTTRTIPKTPKVFSYSAEVYDVLQAEENEVADVEFHRVWYDSGRKIARLDKFSRQRYTSELYDFNTGVTYSNLDGQTCTIKPLRYSMFEIYNGKMMGKFKEPEEVLNLDGEFYYMGQRLIRGIWADSYESIQKEVVFQQKTLAKLVVTVYFSQEFYKIAVNGETESQIPIYYIITGWDKPGHISVNLQYNIFGFDDVIWPQMYQNFQLGRCFPNMNDKSYFILIMNVQPELAATMEKNDDAVMERLRSKITQIAKVSDMRLPLLTADYKASGVFVTGLMLDRPPAIAQFIMENEGDVNTPDPDVRIIPDAHTTEKCATACVDEEHFTCTGFYFCKTDCFVKAADLMDPADVNAKHTILGKCQTWLRAEAQSNSKETPLKDALSLLEKAVLNETFKIVLKLDDIKTDFIPVNDIVIGDGPYTGDNTQDKPYNEVITYAKLNPDDTTTQEMHDVDNINACYKSCKDSESLNCASFSYCPGADNKQCMITSVLIVDRKHNPDDTKDDKECYVYSLKYMDFYVAYPGRVALISGEDSFTKINAVEDCAKLCHDETKFDCRGFEYCRTAKSCVLHSKHVLDMKDGELGTDKKSACTHYAVKYAADYYDMGYTLVKDDSDSRSQLTLEQCSRVCSEEMKSNCKSFNYCPASGPYATDSSCRLSTKLLKDANVPTTTEGKCHHYEKKKVVDDWAKEVKKPVIKQSGYTKKGFTGLVVGMLALGLILGSMGFVIYSYFRARSSGEGMTVRFMKSDI
ncbi:uncharacterized protein CEXT_647971 [Caerostris extrusa]|uniref:Apple domain-containing protein n=1 Tax=Caerostris extrusa TaxID=172846 RepID=A0AAV4PZP2_CAEEX|nr:uncharacterized protein CEXT_647971 [Caerostris extrusa]